jgi:hypothetical protein
MNNPINIITPPPPFQNSFCVYLENVFTPEECIDHIKISEDKGYEKALVTKEQVVDLSLRNSGRCIIDDKVFAEEIFNRVRHAIPYEWGKYIVTRMNERLRYLRYYPGEYFKPHFDGSYRTPNGSENSKITMQLYLNDDFEGGRTIFLPNNRDNHDTVPFVPKTGSVLLFEHHILHEGEEVLSGCKYAIRSDIMYKHRNSKN